ncbi:hypothetical protein KHA80_10125 [Anaerobacillus sp. HL2]|nr:hypothetical protein KHA80_10125 [Anaerobacillus sp. HL2]
MKKFTKRRNVLHFVIYGKDISSKPVFVNETDFIKTIKITGKNGIIFLATDNGTYEVIAKNLQTEALKGGILHIDFFKVDMKKEMDVNVPIHFSWRSRRCKGWWYYPTNTL